MARCLTALLLLFLLPRLGTAAIVDSLAAVIDGSVITRTQVEEFQARSSSPGGASPELRRTRALDELIDRTLVRQEAKRVGIEVTDADVEAAVDEIRTRNGLPPEAFQAAILGQGLTYEAYLDEIRFQILRARVAGRVLRDRVRVGDEALREYYLKNVAEYREPEAVRLCHIQVPASERETAEEIRRRTLAGEDPMQLARKGSIGTQVSGGGDTGLVPVDNLAETVRAAIANLPAGGVSPVVETGDVCHLFSVLERRDGRIPPFEEVRDRIRDLYFQDMEEELYRTWIESLREKARIERKM